MKKMLAAGLMLFLFSCTNNDKERATSENDVDAARNFIRSALDGKWNEAKNYMLQDSSNLQLLDAAESNYRTHMNAEDKRGYREASINLLDSRQVADSITIVTYSNSFKKQQDSLRVVRINNQWQVDLKYSFPQTDTTQHDR